MSPMPNKQNQSSYLSTTNENDNENNNTSSINNSNNNNNNNNCSMNNRNNGSVNEDDENDDLVSAERRLNKNIKVKLCDFSFSQIMSPGKNILGMMGTVAYSGKIWLSF